MDEEIPKQIGKRYEIKNYVENTRPQLGRAERERAILGLEVLNLAFDELSYSGQTLPHVVFAVDLNINGTLRTGAFAPEWEGKDGQPTFFMDIGSNPADKFFSERLSEYLRQNGWNNDMLNKSALIDAFFEEAYHFVDFTKGKLPKGIGSSGILKEYAKHENQPHEIEARHFAEEMRDKYFNSLVYEKPKLY